MLLPYLLLGQNPQTVFFFFFFFLFPLTLPESERVHRPGIPAAHPQMPRLQGPPREAAPGCAAAPAGGRLFSGGGRGAGGAGCRLVSARPGTCCYPLPCPALRGLARRARCPLPPWRGRARCGAAAGAAPPSRGSGSGGGWTGPDRAGPGATAAAASRCRAVKAKRAPRREAAGRLLAPGGTEPAAAVVPADGASACARCKQGV